MSVRNKHRNTPTVIGAEKYRSKREAKRHQELLLLQRAGQIAGLVREVPFVLAPAVRFAAERRQKPALRYFADFVYSDVVTGAVVIEDAKGDRTDVYRIKKHLMKSIHNIEVIEV